MLRILLLILLAVVFAFGVALGFYNAQPVRFSYLLGEFELPLIGLIVGEFLLAVLLTLVVIMGRILALKAQIRQLKRQLQNTEAELKNLRSLPLDAPAKKT